ncbi:MAG: glycosyltransferase [Candidatus Hydrothermarchaeaceae archaeon]
MNVIYFSDINWNFLWQRHQQIVTRFPEDWNILFMQPSFFILLLQQPAWALPRRLKNIRIASLITVPWVDRLPKFVRRINDHMVVLFSRLLLKIYRMEDPVVIISEPRFSGVVGKLRERLVCYDFIDNRLEFAGVPDWMEHNINFLLSEADLVFASGQNLYDMASERRERDLYLIGNGVDVEHFKRAMGDIAIPEDVRAVKKPVLGFVGAVSDWIDFQLIEEILKSGVSVVLIGPVMGKIEELEGLESYPNFHLLGKRPYSSLPGYIKGFDACIIPFKLNELTRCFNPVKVHEYLAAGKPVISTALPEIEMYKDVVYIAKDSRAFMDCIDEALGTDYDRAKALRMAAENDWGKKVEEMVELIVNHPAVKSEKND